MPIQEELRVQIGGDNSRLKRIVRESQGILRRFGDSAARLARRTALVTAAATAAGVALTTAFVKRGLQSVDALSKLARQLDTTVESVQVLQRAGELAGIPNLNKQLQAITRALGEARQGTGTAKDALERLGLTLEELERLPVDQRLIRMAEAMDRLGLTAADRANVLREFQVRGTAMINLFENGAEAIRRATREVNDFGLALSDAEAAAVEEANDSLSRLGLAIEAVRNQLTVTVAPYLDVIADGLFTASKGGIQLRQVFDDLFKRIARGLFVLDEFRQNFFGDEEVKAARFMQTEIQLIGARIQELEQQSQQVRPGTNLRQGFEEEISRLSARQQAVIDEFQMLPQNVLDATVSAEERYREFLRGLEQSQQEFIDTVQLRQDEARSNRERQAAAAGARELEQETERRRELNEAILELEQEFSEAYERELEKRQRAEYEANRRRIDFERKSRSEQTQHVLGLLRQQLSGIERHNKTLFRISKAVASAEALVNTYAGAARALKDYPAPLSFGIAAAVTAFGLARVAAINAQGFGGGGGGAAGGGGAVTSGTSTDGVPGALPVSPGREVLDVRITADEGQIFTKRQLAQIIDEINEEAGDGRSLSISVV